MSFLTASGAFPPIKPTTSHDVTAEERITAVDFVNRVNYLFEEFDHAKILSAFLPDAIAYHFHGTIRGHSGLKTFLEKDYPYLIPGVTRHATNHIVDRDDETGGVVVRYHTQLVRFAWPRDADKVTGMTAEAVENTDGLPAIWLWSPVIDRLKMTEEGWKVHEKYIGGSVVNKNLSPSPSE
ncbi:hypothetical protein MPH_05631 [Macrophomina phaseolina MS6]|uniref:SnoaL-like domain-containing protein n=1 Tax=Macrophomina phaseolina (strain MS6) TaxID=1126212 RepID=K2RWT5_MACPH|nr:hypothetical protein MPH_05631 [Macrophomina phaseolina MS6]